MTIAVSERPPTEGYAFVVTCGNCGDRLAPVVEGGGGTQSTALGRCINCKREWVIQVHMAAFVGCGTEAGYARHKRTGEKPCDDCREARNRGILDRKIVRHARHAAMAAS